ncbi:hypothetical protein B0H14DRAFT_791344 [Mycena olivaceomarginata]|nr:hypothetical protein B0H14DRAFT_791344 [Mycena olivaceomarginata]
MSAFPLSPPSASKWGAIIVSHTNRETCPRCRRARGYLVASCGRTRKEEHKATFSVDTSRGAGAAASQRDGHDTGDWRAMYECQDTAPLLPQTLGWAATPDPDEQDAGRLACSLRTSISVGAHGVHALRFPRGMRGVCADPGSRCVYCIGECCTDCNAHGAPGRACDLAYATLVPCSPLFTIHLPYPLANGCARYTLNTALVPCNPLFTIHLPYPLANGCARYTLNTALSRDRYQRPIST